MIMIYPDGKHKFANISYNTVLMLTTPFIGESCLLLLMRLGAANWIHETKASLFELSEVPQFEKVC